MRIKGHEKSNNRRVIYKKQIQSFFILSFGSKDTINNFLKIYKEREKKYCFDEANSSSLFNLEIPHLSIETSDFSNELCIMGITLHFQ